jgi:hypothetical protein
MISHAMSPFRHSHDDAAPESADQGGWEADNARLDGLIDRFTALSQAQIAAELLQAAGTEWALMPDAIDAFAGDRGDGDTSKYAALRGLCAEGFQALVIARLVVGEEQHTNKWGAGDILYTLTRDGKAAVAQGDVAEVVARRLPD